MRIRAHASVRVRVRAHTDLLTIINKHALGSTRRTTCCRHHGIRHWLTVPLGFLSLDEVLNSGNEIDVELGDHQSLLFLFGDVHTLNQVLLDRFLQLFVETIHLEVVNLLVGAVSGCEEAFVNLEVELALVHL